MLMLAGLLGAGVAALLGWAMRRREAEPEDVTLGFLGPSLAALYLLVLALALAAEWGWISDARQAAAAEASALRQLGWAAQGLPAGPAATLAGEVRAYASAVVNHDWPQMRTGSLDDSTLDVIGAMKTTVLRVQPAAAVSPAQTDALTQLTTLAAMRTQREEDTRNQLPRGVLAGVIATSLVVALFPFAVGIRPVLPSVILAAMQGALVVIGVVVVFQLDHPYAGPLAVRPDSMTALVQQLSAP